MSKKYIDLLIKNNIIGIDFVNNVNANLSHNDISDIFNDEGYCLKTLLQSLKNNEKNSAGDSIWIGRVNFFIKQLVKDIFKLSTNNYKVTIDLIIDYTPLQNQVYLFEHLAKIDKNHKNEYLETLPAFKINQPLKEITYEQNGYNCMQISNISKFKTVKSDNHTIKELILQTFIQKVANF